MPCCLHTALWLRQSTSLESKSIVNTSINLGKRGISGKSIFNICLTEGGKICSHFAQVYNISQPTLQFALRYCHTNNQTRPVHKKIDNRGQCVDRFAGIALAFVDALTRTPDAHYSFIVCVNVMGTFSACSKM